MRYFKTLLMSMNDLVKNNPRDSALELESKYVKSAVPFVLDPNLFEMTIDLEKEGYDPSIPLDLPFKTCCFEVYQKDTFTPICLDKSGQPILAMLIHEIEPNKYIFTALSLLQTNLSRVAVTFFEETTLDSTRRQLIFAFLKIMEKNTTASETTRDIVKYRVSGTNYIHRINQVVRVLPKNTNKSLVKPLFGNTLTWSHRWTVRGHWRNIKGATGRNRDGSLIKGFTWVKDHIKGPADKILVRKTRVLSHKDDKNKTTGENV